jgi:hypothetical protein
MPRRTIRHEKGPGAGRDPESVKLYLSSVAYNGRQPAPTANASAASEPREYTIRLILIGAPLSSASVAISFCSHQHGIERSGEEI